MKVITIIYMSDTYLRGMWRCANFIFDNGQIANHKKWEQGRRFCVWLVFLSYRVSEKIEDDNLWTFFMVENLGNALTVILNYYLNFWPIIYLFNRIFNFKYLINITKSDPFIKYLKRIIKYLYILVNAFDFTWDNKALNYSSNDHGLLRIKLQFVIIAEFDL